MITMTEIAKLTHVSQPTVSRVLNGSQRVDPEIRERVLACARAHHYQCNALAKSLQGSKTMLLGVLVTNISNSFFADLAKAIEAEARKGGYSIILFNSDYDAAKEQEYLDIVRRYRVDGVIAVPLLEEAGCWPQCAGRLDVPLVAVTRRVPGLDCVFLDHEAAAGLAARHLAERGCGRYLYIGRERDEKYLGFRKALASAAPGAPLACLEYREDGQLLAGLADWFRPPGPKAGIFANNDLCALRVLDALRRLGVSVPREAGVVGFDDTFMGRYLSPPLTSVSQPIQEMARVAVARLTLRIDQPGEYEPKEIPLYASLSVRESS